MTGEGRLADAGSLRRVELLALAWTAAGVVGYGVARSWPGGLVLTAVSVVGIVLFRGLQGVVSALGPAGDGAAGSRGADRPEAAPDQSLDPALDPVGRRRPVGWRPVLGAVLRFALLGATVAAGAFLLEPEYFPAIVLGFSTLPAAFMTEGLLQVVRTYRKKDRHDVS